MRPEFSPHSNARALARAFTALAVTLLTFGTSSFAAAQEVREFYTGVRQLGMGGAYTGVVNDETALLTNPAGLGKVRDATVTVFDPEFHGSFNNTKVAKLDNFSSVLGVQGLLEALKQSQGTHFHARAQLFPSLVLPNFGLGVLANWNFDAEVDPTGTTYRLDYISDYAVALGYCLRFFGGIVKLGFAGRVVNRVEIRRDIDATSTNLSVDALASEGVGLAADVGLIIAAPVALLPSLSATLRDAGGTSYTLGSGSRTNSTTRPEWTRQRLDVGLSIFPILSNHSRMTFTVEYHDALNATQDDDQMRRTHVGAEVNLSDVFFIRAGMNQRYWTSGFELASERFQIQIASYGEEIGSPTSRREDRRWVTKFSYRY